MSLPECVEYLFEVSYLCCGLECLFVGVEAFLKKNGGFVADADEVGLGLELFHSLFAFGQFGEDVGYTFVEKAYLGLGDQVCAFKSLDIVLSHDLVEYGAPRSRPTSVIVRLMASDILSAISIITFL